MEKEFFLKISTILKIIYTGVELAKVLGYLV
jgi:hypothetical protein